MNRAQRRAGQARNRQRGDVALLDCGTLFLPGETAVETEVLVGRAMERMEAQFGCRVPDAHRTSFADGIRKTLENIDRRERGLPPVGSAKCFDEEALEAGRRLLADMLPRATEMARGIGDFEDMSSWVVEAFRKNGFGIADLEAVMVYRAEPGAVQGWHGDVVFSRNLDPLPNMIGTKSDEPCATREEAEQRALELLATCVFHARKGFDA